MTRRTPVCIEMMEPRVLLSALPLAQSVDQSAPLTSMGMTAQSARLPRVSIRPVRSVTREGGAPLVFILRRWGPSDQVLEVNLTLGGTATPGNDFHADVALDEPIWFGPYQSRVRIQIGLEHELTPEGPETVELSLQPGDGYRLGAKRNVAVAAIKDARANPRWITSSGWWPIVDADLAGEADAIREAALREMLMDEPLVFVGWRRSVQTRRYGWPPIYTMEAASAPLGDEVFPSGPTYAYDDPSDATIAALSEPGRVVKKASEAIVDADGVWDRTTGQRGILLWVERVHRSDTSLLVTAGQYIDSQLGSIRTFHMVNRRGAWVDEWGRAMDPRLADEAEAIQEAALRDVLDPEQRTSVSVLTGTVPHHYRSGRPSDQLLGRLRDAGFDVEPVSGELNVDDDITVIGPFPVTRLHASIHRITLLGDIVEVSGTVYEPGFSYDSFTIGLAKQGGVWVVQDRTITRHIIWTAPFPGHASANGPAHTP
jgi:hypothetical protein